MAFQFKKFKLEDGQTAMKLGTDAIILGTWINIQDSKEVLDIGSGCGIISLILAQRFQNCKITAIEIDPFAFQDLVININASPWQNSINAIHADIIDYSFDKKFDWIVSNPPFFDSDQSIITSSRKLARQKKSLTPEILFEKAAHILNSEGTLAIIYPYSQRFEMITKALLYDLFLVDELQIKDVDESLFKRCIFQFRKIKPKIATLQTLVLKQTDGSYTQEFQNLSQDFYLD